MLEGAVYRQVFRCGDRPVYWTYRGGDRINLAEWRALDMAAKGVRIITVT